MKATSRFGPWRSVLGVLAVGVCAFSLTLEGAPNKGRENSERDLRSPDKTEAPADQAAARPLTSIDRERAAQGGATSNEGIHIQRAGRLPKGSVIPVAPPVTVNPYDDEATRLRNSGEIPWGPYLRPRLAVAGGTCQFNIDCDDCVDCTADRCNIAPFASSGTCVHDSIPNGQGASECSDGLFCNGIETCQGLSCQPGGTGTGIANDPQDQIPCEGECAGGTSPGQRCVLPNDPLDCPGGGTCIAASCDEELNECVIPCTQMVCSAASSNAGKPCAVAGDCPSGACLTPNQVCAERDGNLLCTGTDTCDLATGLCEHTGNPCGPGADCSELTCQNGTACLADTDCLAGTCDVRATAGCFYGRCCASSGGGEFACTIARYQTAPNGLPGQRCATTSVWFATPTGGLASAQGECPGCPKYGSGIADNQLVCIGGADDGETCANGGTCDSGRCDRNFGPTTVVLGPVSQSTCADLFAIGDDYTFSNEALPTNDYVAVEQLVFIGGVETVAEERISFEFYDGTVLIEDIFFVSGSGTAVRTVVIDPPIVLPPTGRVIARAATLFAPSARVFWAATNEVDDVNGAPVGVNNAAGLYVDTTDNGMNDLVFVDYAGVCVGGSNDGDFCDAAVDCGLCLGGANLGDPCDADGDCPGSSCNEGVCDQAIPNILAFELTGDKIAQPIGACCSKATGACDGSLPWNCNPVTHVYLGDGQACASCVGGGNPGGACRRCVGGGNAGTACDQNSDCNSGNCGLTPADCPGGTCTSTAACGTGACCSTAGICSQTTQAACTGPSTFLGFGTDCTPNCCTFPTDTGGDDCDEATVHVVNVPCLNDADCSGGVPNSGKCLNPGASGVCYVTITGNNSGATGPDSCTAAQFDPQQTQDVTTVDPGWWEAFATDECVFVRFDMCCSNPIHAPQWVVMWDSCPCEELGANSYFNSVNPHTDPVAGFDPDLPASARREPFCVEDNLWWHYGPLPEGKTYYQPIYSALAGAHGAYQMHITIAACPQAACCFTECVGGAAAGKGCDRNSDCRVCVGGTNAGNPCTGAGDCPGGGSCPAGGSCNPLCSLLNILDCEGPRQDPDIAFSVPKAGTYLGPPNKSVSITFCSGALCTTGSCCPGPGECLDEEEGVPMTKAACDALNGVYKGAIRCFGGICTGGDEAGESCQDNTACPGGTCAGSEVELAQLSPCPICDIADDAHCQNDPGEFAGTAYISDESVGGEDPAGTSRIADDFVALENGSVTTVCVIGAYISFEGGTHDCAGELPADPDDFVVSIYDGDPANANALPGTLRGSRSTTLLAKGLEFNDGGFDFFRYKLSLDSPIAGLIANNTYWLEVFNNTTNEPEACNWFWLNAAEEEGNSYFMQDLGASYGPEDAAVPLSGRPDAAFCINLANEPPPEPVRACCSCLAGGGIAGGDPNCTDATFFECSVEQKQRWVFEQLECAGFTCPDVDTPVNDECPGAITVFDGDNVVNNRCATNSMGLIDTVTCAGTATRFDNDVWFTYTATCPGPLVRFDTCDMQNGAEDLLMAVYGGNDASCPCPATAGDIVGCNDDGCFWGGTGSQIQLPAAVGNCYLIRLAGFFDDDGAEWEDITLRITCGFPGATSCSGLPPSYESPPDSPPGSPCACEGSAGGDQPLNLYSGEFQTSAVDLQIQGRGLDFTWARKYRSRLGPNTAMGNGWDFSYNIYLEQAGSDLVLHDGNSRRDTYLLQTDGTWAADEFFRVLEQNPDNSYTLTFSDLGEWNLHPLDGSPHEGRIRSSLDRNGNTLTFDYNAQGQLVKIHDTLDTAVHNRDIIIAYNADGFIESVTDFIGRTVVYDYYDGIEPGGGFGDLKSFRSPIVTGTPTGNDFPAGKTTTYTYSTGFTNEELNHNLLTVTDAKGQTFLSLVYGVATQGACSVTTGIDCAIDADCPIGQVCVVTQACDRVTRATWGDPGDNIDITYVTQAPGANNNFAVIKAIVNDRVGNVKEYSFDVNNRLVLQREYTGRANPDQPTTETVNRPTNKLRPTDPDFFETRYEWNADAKPTRVLYPNGNSVELVYELALNANAPRRSRGNLRQERRLPGPLGGDQTEIIELFEYITDMGGCCGTNFVSRHVDGRGHETLHQYDSAGNRTHTTHRIPSIVEDWEYNAFGQMTAHILSDNGSNHRRRDESTYYTQADGAQYGYQKNKIVDAGNFNLTTTNEYDAVGNIIREIDPRDHDTLYTFNALDQLVREVSREVLDGSGVRYWRNTFYDANDNVVREDVQNANGPGAPMCLVDASNEFFTTVFQYEILNRLIRKCEESRTYTGTIPGPVNLPTCSGLPESEFITTVYGYDDNRNRTLLRLGEAVEGRQPNNAVTTLYDERNLMFRKIRGDASGVVAGPPGIQSTTQYDHDGNRNLARLGQGIEDAANPHVTVHSYDGFERRVTSSDPMGNVSVAHYDANGNRTAEFLVGERLDVPGDGEGEKVILHSAVGEYDEENRRIRWAVQHFDCDNNLIGDGQSVTRLFYNGNSDIIRTIDDNDRVTETKYDTANRQGFVTDSKGNQIRYEKPDGSSGYDENSNVVSLKEVEKSDLGGPDETFVTTNQYDNLNRMIQTTNNFANTIRYGYDSRNNLNEQVDALSILSCHSFDGVRRSVRTVHDLDADGADGDGEDIVTSQVWDDSSRRVAQTDDNNNTTRYAYDPLNRLIITQMADGTLHQVGSGATWPLGGSPDLSAFTSGYDVHHNATELTDANGTFVTSVYDLNDRVTLTIIAPAPGVSGDTLFESCDYDGRNRMVFAQDDDSIVERCFDSLHNILREHLTVGFGSMRTITSVYDGVGNQLTITYPSGRVIATTYDEINRQKTIADQQGPIAGCDYVGPHRVARRDYGNGTRCMNAFDGITGIANPPNDFGVKRIVATTHSKISDGSIIDDRNYTWDRMDNKTQRKDIRIGGPALTHDYTYDSIYHLVHTTVTNGVGATIRDTDYDIDGVGNRTLVVGSPDPGTYTLDPTVPPADSPMNQYTMTPFDCRTYDANGNLTQVFDLADCPALTGLRPEVYSAFLRCLTGPEAVADPLCRGFDRDKDGDVDLADFERMEAAIAAGPGPTVIFAYDYRNQMVEYADAASGQRHTYAYDVHGRRIARVVDADGLPGVTRYYYDDRRVVEEQDGTGTTQATYVYGGYIDDVLNMRRGGSDFYYHADDMYNIMAVTNASGNVVERYQYGDYGSPTFLDANSVPIPATMIGNPFLFSGRNFDHESELYYYRSRYLDPTAGRFTTRDTIGIWEDSANHGNAFAYVANNPWGNTDPSGQYQTPKFKNCSTDQESAITEAVKHAEDLAFDAFFDVFGHWGDDKYPCHKKFRKWFGKYKTARGNEVEDNLDYIHDILWLKKLRFNCDCDTNDYAYVLPSGQNRIWICKSFWFPAQLLGTNSRAGTLIHELAHEIGMWSHPATGTAECEQLAVNKPQRAVRNPDSYEYFAENTPPVSGHHSGCEKTKTGSGYLSVVALCASVLGIYYLRRTEPKEVAGL